MNDAVMVGAIALAVSMGGIVVLAALGGLLVTWFESRADHGGEH